jgi:hypothetical protein
MKHFYSFCMIATLLVSCGPLNDMNSSTAQMNGTTTDMNSQMAAVKGATVHMASQMDDVATSVTKIIAKLPVQNAQNDQSDFHLLNFRYNVAVKIALTKMAGIDVDILSDAKGGDDLDRQLLIAVNNPLDIGGETATQMDAIAGYLSEASRVKQVVQNLKGTVEVSPTLNQVMQKTKVTIDTTKLSDQTDDEIADKTKRVDIINHGLDLLRK